MIDYYIHYSLILPILLLSYAYYIIYITQYNATPHTLHIGTYNIVAQTHDILFRYNITGTVWYMADRTCRVSRWSTKKI